MQTRWSRGLAVTATAVLVAGVAIAIATVSAPRARSQADAGDGTAPLSSSSESLQPPSSSGAASTSATTIDPQVASVQTAADAAVVAWQTLFIEEPQAGVTSPNQVLPKASAMSADEATAFVAQASQAASLLFEGHPLQVLQRSLASEVQTSSPEAIAALRRAEATDATMPANEPTSAPGYSICVAAGANSFSFTNVSISGTSATVDMTAYAWTSNIDVTADGQATVDTAQGAGSYHLGMTQSAAGTWMVDSFDAAPTP